MASLLDLYRSVLGGDQPQPGAAQIYDVGSDTIPLSLDRTQVNDPYTGTALQQLLGKLGDVGTAIPGLVERAQLGGMNALRMRQPGGDIYRSKLPVAPGIEALGDIANFATGGLQSSLFPRGGAYREAARYALPKSAEIGREISAAFPGLLADEAGTLRIGGKAADTPWAPSSPAIIRGSDTALDYRGINMAERPDVPQFPLDRPSFGPRANTEKWTGLDTPETWERYQRVARLGLPEGRSGGREWYNTQPLLRAFMEINPDTGAQDFRRFIDYVGASSPSNPVPQNIRTASYLYHADKQGLELPTLYRGEGGGGRASIYPSDVKALLFPKDAAGKDLPSGLSAAEERSLKAPHGLPSGYGGLPQTDWLEHAANLRRGGAFDLATNPKPPSFVQNLMGNYEPFTIDRHNMRVMAGWTPEGKYPAGYTDAPPPQAYGLLEGIQRDYARRLGLDPAQTQAATWLGGETGVKSSLSQPFVGEFEEKLNLAAQKARLSPHEMLRDFVLGNRPL